jgi:hypothetical protein
MDTVPFVLPNKTRVIIVMPQGEFKGMITGSGYQSQQMKYFVLLDDPTNYPKMPPGEFVAIVDTDIVKVDISTIGVQ